MKFLLEAQIGGIPYAGARYRLQQDSTWNELDKGYNKFPTFGVTAIDKLFDTLPEAKKCVPPLEIALGGKIYKVNSGHEDISLGEVLRRVGLEPRVFRITPPETFTLEEVREVISNGNDRQNNCLCVGLDGKVYLHPFHPSLISSFAPIAVRYETFCAGNGYVGKAAAKDKRHVKNTYLGLLEGWVTHLSFGELNVHDDEPISKSEEELLKEIKELTTCLAGYQA